MEQRLEIKEKDLTVAQPVVKTVVYIVRFFLSILPFPLR